jgi:hypothetical protein
MFKFTKDYCANIITNHQSSADELADLQTLLVNSIPTTEINYCLQRETENELGYVNCAALSCIASVERSSEFSY